MRHKINQPSKQERAKNGVLSKRGGRSQLADWCHNRDLIQAELQTAEQHGRHQTEILALRKELSSYEIKIAGLAKALDESRKQESSVLDTLFRSPSQLQATMAHCLVMAEQKLTLVEKRLLTFAATRLFVKKGGMAIRVSAIEYAELFRLHYKTAYKELRTAASKLRKAGVFVPIDGGVVEIGWLSSAAYLSRDQVIEVRFTPEMEGLLRGLTEKFTRYRLEHIANIRKVGSWRLMEVCAKWNSIGKFRLTLPELHKILDATSGQRENFGQFNLRVIQPAIDELNKGIDESNPADSGLDLGLSMERKFDGNHRVVALWFNFTRYRFGGTAKTPVFDSGAVAGNDDDAAPSKTAA